MTIREMKAKAMEAFNRAKQIRDSQSGKEWTGEAQANYDAAVKESTEWLQKANAEEARASVQSQFETLDREFNQPATPPLRSAQEPQQIAPKEQYKRAFDKFLRQSAQHKHLEGLSPQECHALTSVDNTLGGFLIPEDFQSEVIKDMAGFAVIRRVARVIPTGKNVVTFPTIQSATSNANIYSSGYTGSWRIEGYVTGGTAPTVQNFPKFGQSRIPVHVWQPDAIELTQELLEDSEADLMAILAEVIAETKALDEDYAFISGSGVAQPLGLLNGDLTSVNSGSNSGLTYGGLLDLFNTLPSQYRQNARWLMNSLCFGGILKLEDSEGRVIFPPNMLPGTLWGKEVLFSEWMPAHGTSSNKPIIFGDFRYYGIAERKGLAIQRLVERYAPNVGILATARVGGQVLRTAAFRQQNVSA